MNENNTKETRVLLIYISLTTLIIFLTEFLIDEEDFFHSLVLSVYAGSILGFFARFLVPFSFTMMADFLSTAIKTITNLGLPRPLNFLIGLILGFFYSSGIILAYLSILGGVVY